MQVQNTGLRNNNKKVHGILSAPKFLAPPPPVCLSWSVSSAQNFLWLISLIYSFKDFFCLITEFLRFSSLLLWAQYEWQCLCYWEKCWELRCGPAACVSKSACECLFGCVYNPQLHLFFHSKNSTRTLVSLCPITTPWPGAKPLSGAAAAHQNTGRRALDALASWHQHRPSQAGETSETRAHIKAPPSGRRSGEASILSVSAGVRASEALSHLHLERESEGSLMVW